MTLLFDTIIEKLNIRKIYSNGFHTFNCPICAETRGRGGISQKDDAVIIHCFNCSYKGAAATNLSRLHDFLSCIMSDLEIAKLQSKLKPSDKTNSSITKSVSNIISLDEFASYKTSKAAIKYVNDRLLPTDYNFRVKKEFGNIYLIIPFFDERNQPVWYQVRLIVGRGMKYINCTNSKDGILFNSSALNNPDIKRIYIFEGPIDSLSIWPLSIALAGSEISNTVVNKLIKCNKELVFCYDNDEKGVKFAKHLKKLIPNVLFTNLSDVKDANEYLMKTESKIDLLIQLNRRIHDELKENISNIKRNSGIQKSRV